VYTLPDEGRVGVRRGLTLKQWLSLAMSCQSVHGLWLE